MNLDTFLTLERRQLLEERQWLERKRNSEQIAALTTNKCTRTEEKRRLNDEEEEVAVAEMEKATVAAAVNEEKSSPLPVMDERTLLKQQQYQQKQQLSKEVELSKDAKERANKKNSKQQLNDDQWVTDTFYAYFPGFSNEDQKRQIYLRERQRQNQENFLKHFPAGANTGKENVLAAQKRRAARRFAADDQDAGGATNRSATNALNTARSMHSNDKTELEIIVNNPNYSPPKVSARPGSTRHKLLQDLRHTELSQIITGNGISERNKRSSEMETARKKDYQRELMEQIEDKRRSIERLRDKERQQEETLTKRLQEQLSTLKLEEALEQERIYALKLRKDNEQNRFLRQELIAKLEEDSALLQAKSSQNVEQKTKEIDSQNKVYQYFSNSAQREYRRGQPLPLELEVNSLEMPLLVASEANCTHHHRNNVSSCPLCDAQLKNYESCCLRCQKKLTQQLNTSNDAKTEQQNVKVDSAQTSAASADTTRSFSLVCVKCERLYTLCRTCLLQNDICSACHCKRNVCMNCRRALCPVCLDAVVAAGVADNADERTAMAIQPQKPKQVNHSALGDIHNNYCMEANSPVTSKRIADSTIEATNTTRPPYSMNIERNSIFHPDFDIQAIRAGSAYDASPVDDVNAASTPLSIERVRKETEKRLSHYFKHYGDLVQLRSRSTQTTPESAGRRDVVLHEEHNLSIPLLREMPKMTRATMAAARQAPMLQSRTRIEQLKRRWEVPAVQKYIISPSNPKVLTQVGAMRKQLQAADFN